MKNFLFTCITLLLLSCVKEDTNSSPVPISTFNVTISSGGGGTVNSAGGTYEKGTKISLTATPDDQYVFEKWSDGNTENPREVTITSNLSLTANFIKRKYALTLHIEGEGAVQEEILVQGSVSTNEYNSGTKIKLVAIPNQGWMFLGWSGDVESTENPIEVDLTEAKDITATFKIIEYDLTVLIEGNGTVTERIIEQTASGTQIELTAAAGADWEFDEWITESFQSKENPLVFTIEESLSITAKFNKINIQGGFDQPTILNAKIAVIPIDFIDTPDDIRELYPTTNQLKDIITSEKIKNYFSTVSYGLFDFEIEIFDFYRLPFPGIEEGILYGSEILSHNFNIEGLDPNLYDYLMFVPIHDWGLAGGVQNRFELTINGVNYPFGEINSIMVPIFIGNFNRDQSFEFQNSTVYKKGYSIPLGEESSEEGDIAYELSNFEQTFLHESIHALGIASHSMSKTNGSKPDYEPIDQSNGGLEHKDYGDKFCIMGSGEYSLSLTSAYRDYLGWHNETVRKRVVDFGISEVNLYPINTYDQVAYIEVRIPNKINEFSSIGYKNEGYFLEVRSENDPWDNFLTNQHLKENLEGVFVKKTDGFTSWLLDMSPSENINFYGQITADIRDVVLKPSMTYENDDIRITVISKNNDGSFAVEIEIK